MQDDTPSDIVWFERLCLGSIVLTVVVTVSMFDWSVGRVGPNLAVLFTICRFSMAFLLMLFCTRRRSNVARWLVVLFTLSMLAYDIVRVPVMLDRNPVLVVVLLRLGLMIAAAGHLFTRQSRAWFANRNPV